MKTICYLTLALVIAVIVLAVTGCAATTFYDAGHPVARFPADMAKVRYLRHADGSVEWQAEAVSHSAPIRSSGNAASKVIGATGTAASAAFLLK